MICSNCNNEIIPGAQFCSRCGAHIMPPAAQPYPQATGYYPPVFYNRVARHVQTLGLLWLIYGIWRLLSRLVGLTFMHTFFHWHHEFPFSFAVWPAALSSMLLGFALSMLTAYGLLQRQAWGRIMAIVTAIFALVHPVLGTVLGIYTLWVLAPSASGIEYNTLTAPAPSAPTSTVS